ncbi:MAG TPA: hypothetical protein VKH46_11605 [Thermoanaerobaculia bacterium]|jgi:hypothetical protein|nr:hypothetical protein [Thermoanaerobaculia bacterium]
MKGFREHRALPARLVVLRAVVAVSAVRKIRIVRKPRPVVSPVPPEKEGK